MDIRELLRYMQKEPSNRTVKRYRQWASKQKLLEGALPSHEALNRLLDETLLEVKPPQNQSTTVGYGELIDELVSQNVQVTAIYQRIKERGFTGSYSAVLRRVRQVQPKKG